MAGASRLFGFRRTLFSSPATRLGLSRVTSAASPTAGVKSTRCSWPVGTGWNSGSAQFSSSSGMSERLQNRSGALVLSVMTLTGGLTWILSTRSPTMMAEEFEKKKYDVLHTLERSVRLLEDAVLQNNGDDTELSHRDSGLFMNDAEALLHRIERIKRVIPLELRSREGMWLHSQILEAEELVRVLLDLEA